jgi:hypothetical protein
LGGGGGQLPGFQSSSSARSGDAISTYGLNLDNSGFAVNYGAGVQGASSKALLIAALIAGGVALWKYKK